MSILVYAIVQLMCGVLVSVPLGTNRDLFILLWALMSGRFLSNRGAVFASLDAMGLSAPEVRRAEAALAYGRFDVGRLLADWAALVLARKQWQPHRHEGIRPVACDLTGFYRPRLGQCPTKHYKSTARTAQPALVYGLCVAVGSVGTMRLGLPRLLLRRGNGESELTLQQRLIEQASASLAEDEALLVDAGFPLSHLREQTTRHYVARLQQNATARRNELPAYSGKGRRTEWGERVRPLARSYADNALAATEPDAIVAWKDRGFCLRAHLFENLVAPDEKPGGVGYRIIVVIDPRYEKPLVLATDLSVSAEAVWRLYRDRWPVEQLPLAAKQMLGAERSFVSGKESRYRLPELALLAGNLLSYAAATGPSLRSGFWDRCPRPTCGRLRRYLQTVPFSKIPLPEGQVRKKASITDHLAKGVLGHRRKKAAPDPKTVPYAA